MKDIAALSHRSASAIGRVLAAGEVSPVALAEHLLQRIEASASDPVFLAVTAERALAEASAAEARFAAGRPASPLDGVPIVWKDLIDLAGEVTTAGSDMYRNAPPASHDAPVAANAAMAGMVSLGKVNLTEFAFSGLGHNPHFGTPANPHDSAVRRSPGGSSSGSAIAVATSMAPCAVGTDTGGSVRVPAAFNGLVGYKPSQDRIDTSQVFPLSYSFDTVGPLARSVEDCVFLDMILRGAVTSRARRRAPSDLAIFVPETIVLDDLAPDVAANFEESLSRLEASGTRIIRGSLQIFADIMSLIGEFGSIVAAEAYLIHRDVVDGPDVGRVDRRVVARIMGGKNMSAADLLRLQRARRAMIAELPEKLDQALIAMPTVAITAPEIASLDADDDLFHRTNLKVLRNTSIGNFLDMPGLALPNGTDRNNLPTSFLLSSTSGDDARLLGYGLGLEELLRA